MMIIYDDLQEFTEARFNCEQTRNKKKCGYCPFCSRCTMSDVENLHTMCCEILSMQKKGGEQG